MLDLIPSNLLDCVSMFGTHPNIPIEVPDLQELSDVVKTAEDEDEPVSSANISCPQCGRTFTVKNNLRRHMKNFHPEGKLECGKEQYTQVCAICGDKFRFIKDLQLHLEKDENITLSYEKQVFYSEEDFKEWKRKTEEMTCSLFVARSGAKKVSSQESKSMVFYVCHRSGAAKFRKVRKSNRKCASIKCGYGCPALMKVCMDTFHEASEIEVEYQSVHVGHEITDTIMKRKRLRDRRRKIGGGKSKKISAKEKLEKQREEERLLREAEQQAALMEEIRQAHIAEVNTKQSLLLGELQEIQNIIMKTGSLEKLRFIQESFTNIKAYCSSVPEGFTIPQFPPVTQEERLPVTSINKSYLDQRLYQNPQPPPPSLPPPPPQESLSHPDRQPRLENTHDISSDNFLYILYQDS